MPGKEARRVGVRLQGTGAKLSHGWGGRGTGFCPGHKAGTGDSTEQWPAGRSAVSAQVTPCSVDGTTPPLQIFISPCYGWVFFQFIRHQQAPSFPSDLPKSLSPEQSWDNSPGINARSLGFLPWLYQVRQKTLNFWLYRFLVLSKRILWIYSLKGFYFYQLCSLNETWAPVSAWVKKSKTDFLGKGKGLWPLTPARLGFGTWSWSL